MAMKPFIGYNVGDYWAHWLEMGEMLGDKAPKIFNVNWFKQDENGEFIWPGFGDNMRVLDWIIKRCEGEVDAQETAIGYLPKKEDLNLAQRCAGRPAIALVNKEDKPTQFDAEVIAPYFAMLIPVCCQEEGARKVIAAAVARLLGTNQIDPHAASLSGQRQLSAATRARDAVSGALDAIAGGFGLDAVSVCVDDALDALCELTGENASEAVINEVFERFCVGK